MDSLTDEINFYNFLGNSRNGPVNAMIFIKDTIHIFGFNNRIPTIWKIYDFSEDGDSLDILLYDELVENQVFAEGIQSKGDYFYLAGRTWGKDPWTTNNDLMVIKSDKQGNKIKEERFWDIAKPDMENVIWDYKKTKDENFVLSFTGLSKDEDGSYKIAKLIKFDENLDTIWSKVLNRNHGLSFSYPMLSPTNDGGIVMTWSLFTRDIKGKLGEEYPKLGQFPPTIYKFDSMGCFEPGCCQLDTIQMIEVDNIYVPDTIGYSKDSITIFPNPAIDKITIMLPKACSPRYSGDDLGINWTIRNISGIHIKNGSVGQRTNSFDINIKDMPKGLYFLEVKDKGRDIYTLKKIIVE